MKIYHTETQEAYDALMMELEDKGILWMDKTKPTSHNYWIVEKEETVIRLRDSKRIAYLSLLDAKTHYPDTPIQTYKAEWYQRNLKEFVAKDKPILSRVAKRFTKATGYEFDNEFVGRLEKGELKIVEVVKKENE